jgi:hypothetical protein
MVSATVLSRTVSEYSLALMDCHGERGGRGEENDAGPRGRIAIGTYTGI